MQMGQSSTAVTASAAGTASAPAPREKDTKNQMPRQRKCPSCGRVVPINPKEHYSPHVTPGNLPCIFSGQPYYELKEEPIDRRTRKPSSRCRKRRAPTIHLKARPN